MRISKIFETKFLNATDLNGDQHRVIIDSVDVEEFPEGKKPVLRFTGRNKQWVVNRTNAATIAMVLGDDTDDWIGKEIILFPTTATDSHGKTVPAIRVTVPKPSKAERVGDDRNAQIPS